eukprot:TRINITY_DN4751_c0_g1_i1.p1 TRINITY_DN4751_c0_g1~~TRINITY_DN4751_c0_g1_i1.p1  ORF type:complete len:234 (+),score=35.04 TRINITY_DN4751_c0_g1_i1:80-781(+)
MPSFEDGDVGVTAADVSRTKLDIFVCRHGTTTWNLEKRWQGEQDTDLAEEGILQAEATAKVLASRAELRGVKKIFCSDLKRAHRTAEIYAKELGCEVVVEPRLREPCLGNFEGMVKKDIYSTYSELFERLAKMGQQERLLEPYFEGLETPLATCLRVEETAKQVFSELPLDQQAVLFVSHSKVLEAVLAKVFGKFYEGVHTTPCAFFHWRYSESAHELGDLSNIECKDHQVEQ